MKEKIKEVAKTLGGQFNQKYDHGAEILFSNFYLFVRYNAAYNNDKQITVSVSNKREGEVYISRLDQVDSVKIGKTKSAEQIAKDIKRRVIPLAIRYGNIVNESLIANDNRMKDIESVANKMVSLSKEGVTFNKELSEIDTVFGRFKISQDDFSYIDLRMIPHDLGIHILKEMIKWKK